MAKGSDNSGVIVRGPHALRALGVALVMAVLSAACGSQHTGRPASAAPAVLARDAADGTTVRLSRGQHLQVRLTARSYRSPISSLPAVVVRRSSAGGYPGAQPVEADFRAVTSGSADVSATSDAACLHSRPRCLIPQRLWTVHVVVR